MGSHEHSPRSGDPHETWRTLRDAVSDVVGAAHSRDERELGAARAAAGRASGVAGEMTFLDTVRVPADAGEHADGLARILARIPDGWGRWISCGPGWYGLLCDLDAELARLLPGYEVHQVKEKFAGLRYYIAAGETAGDPTGAEDLRRRSELAARLVRGAEARAAVTCELCGAPGQTRCTPAASPYLRVACADCGAEHALVTVTEHDAWWEAEQPRFEARARARFVDASAGRSAVVLATDETVRVSLPHAVYLRTVEQATATARGDADIVFLADAELAAAFAAALRVRHGEHERRISRERDAARAARKPYAYPSPDGCPDIYMLTDGGRGAAAELQAIGVCARWDSPALHDGPLLPEPN